MGRGQMMKQILKKTNQEFIFDPRCGRMPLEGFKQESYVIHFEF